MTIRMRTTLVRVVWAGVALLGAAPALASTGVSIDVSRIEVVERLRPGDTYRLPEFGVRNPGTEPTRYRVMASAVGDGTALVPDAAWFRFSPADVVVEPGATTVIRTRLVIPEDAEAGSYAVLIGPQIVGEGTGAVIGAAAAAKLTFIVGRCDDVGCWLTSMARWLTENPVVLLAPGLLACLAGIRYVGRRFTIRIARRS